MLRERAESEEDIARLENLRELVNALAETVERGETLEDFLDSAALVSDADHFDDHAPVTLLTLHTAKGLEFDHVFLTGLEEGTFPHNRTLGDPEQIEEERRLCYVGMTRARDTLTITRAVYRRIYGSERLQASTPSLTIAVIEPSRHRACATAYGYRRCFARRDWRNAPLRARSRVFLLRG